MVEYKTVKFQASEEFIERRSRFIGHIKPVMTEDDAISFINEIRDKYRDATHNVYAYSLREGQIKRYSDDGEPQGTAGIPSLDVILKNNVTDVVVVVTRYFGGIMLGAGGLVRAYSHAASLALSSSEVVTINLCNILTLKCDYSQYGKVSSIIVENGGNIDSSEFTNNVEIKFHIFTKKTKNIIDLIANATSGTAVVENSGQGFFR